MSVSNKMKTLWRGTVEGGYLFLLLCLSLVLGPLLRAGSGPTRWR